MMDQTQFQECMQLLEQKHPALALQLRGYSPSEQHCSGPCSILCREDQSVLFVYRLCSLVSIEQMLPWLSKPDRYVVLLEKTHADILAFLILPEAKALLQQSAFSCYVLSEFHEESFLKLAWEGVFLPRYFVTAFEDDESFVQWKQQMDHYSNLAFLIASEYRDNGKKVTENFYRNFSVMQESFKIQHVKFPGVPAIICGAGPSVLSDLQRCQQLSTQALIFAGGALLSVCAQERLIPHIGAMVDPDPPYMRFKNGQLFELPMVYQMRLSHDVLRLMHGPKMLSAGSGESALEEYFFHALEESMPTLESGWNVANFMAVLAAEMGCTPIILLGMDMSYQPEREYLSGVLEREYKGEHMVTTAQGKAALSRKDLLMGNAFFSTLMKRYPHQTWINATAEGLLIEGMDHMSLEQAAEMCLMHYDIQGLLHAQRIESDTIVLNKMVLQKTKERLQESFDHTLSLLDSLLLKLEKSCWHQKENLSKTYEGVDLALEESDLEEEIVYQTILEPLWQIWRWVFFRGEQERIRTLEGKLQQMLFFQRVTKEHQALFHQIYSTGYKNL